MNLYHYGPNSALVSIVENREIWASEFSLSNDIMEGKWVQRIFGDYCREKGISNAHTETLLKHLSDLSSFAGAAGFCMSGNGDLLSQWRGYADDGAGIAIGFNSEYFEELGKHKQARGDSFNASLQKIEYDIEKQKKLIAERSERILELVSEGALERSTLATQALFPDRGKEVAAKFRELIGRFMLFIFDLYVLKNPAFSEEKEWRLISHLFGNPSNSDFVALHKMDFRAKRDRIIPYFRIPLEPLDHNSIVEVILGPKNITPVEFVKAFLAKNGWSDVTVHQSAASYR